MIIKQHLERAKEKVYMYNQNFNVIKQHLELAKEKVHAMKQSSDAAEQTIKAMEEESTVKDCQFQAMQKTTQQLQSRLKDKEQEIIGLKKCLLFRWKNTPNLKRKQTTTTAQKETKSEEDEEITSIKQKNEQLQSQLCLIEEHLKSKEAHWNVELERLGKERQGLAGANEALIEKNVQLQKQLNLIQNILRTKEPRPAEQEKTKKEKRHHRVIAGETGQARQVQKQTDHVQEVQPRPKELHLYVEQRKWEKEKHAPLGENEPSSPADRNEELHPQNQPDAVREELKPPEGPSSNSDEQPEKRPGLAVSTEASADQNRELQNKELQNQEVQNQVDTVQEDLVPKELHPSVDDEKLQKAQQGSAGENETKADDQNEHLQKEPDLVQEEEEPIAEELHSNQEKLGSKRPALADESKDMAEQLQTTPEPLSQ